MTRIGLLERPHPPGHRGAVVDALVPLLTGRGLRVEVVHADRGLHRLDAPPSWDLTVLKSGSAAALHLAAAAEAWKVPCVNGADATRLAQDRIAVALLLQRAGLPVPRSAAAWLTPDGPGLADDRDLVVKASRGSRGQGVWPVPAGGLDTLRRTLPAGPYLLMDRVPHAGDDLKVYVAGDWSAAIERRYPARTLTEKRGRPVDLPAEADAAARAAGRLLGLSCFGCDFVRGPGGWVLVDVNAFPGYKGADGAPEALAAEIARAAG